MKTKCMIVDDEPLARELIRGHIEKLENFEIVAECDNAMKALSVLREKHVDRSRSFGAPGVQNSSTAGPLPAPAVCGAWVPLWRTCSSRWLCIT